MVPIDHQLRPLLSGLATTFHRLSSTASYVRDFEREVAYIWLSAGSQVTNGPVRPHRCSMSTWRSACTEPWRGPGGWQQCSGAWQRQPRCPRHRAAQDSFAAATLPRCCDDACTASSRGVSSIYQTQDQCPSLAPARAVGGGTPLGLGGFLPPLDDSKGAWTNFEPSRPSPHTTPHRIRSSLSQLDSRDCRSTGASQGGAAMATTATMVSDVSALIHTLLLALLCPCAHPLACSLTSYLPSPRSVDARGVRPHGCSSGRGDKPTLW